MTVLITGGAGFIGSYLADELIRRGDRVRALDVLAPQVHPAGQRPDYLHPDVELIVGDVRDEEAVARALGGVDVVVHLAAAVGVGQSMYQIAHYTGVNNLGAAVLLQALAERPVERLLVASSMSVYGEGLYTNAAGDLVEPAPRSLADLKAGRWEPIDEDGDALQPLPTPESKRPSIESVYALSKFDQERLCLMVGRAYGIRTFALRLFNVFGPRQALSNPYTGVLAIFASRLLNRRPPLVFEDGLQRRDFVSVHDVVQGFVRALDTDLRPDEDANGVFNIGSGTAYTVRDVARLLGEALGVPDIAPELTGKYRVGDIRHCFADISHARGALGYDSRVSLADGLVELTEWLRDRTADDRVAEARAELTARGLAL